MITALFGAVNFMKNIFNVDFLTLENSIDSTKKILEETFVYFKYYNKKFVQ
jgi:hypothetical protein